MDGDYKYGRWDNVFISTEALPTPQQVPAVVALGTSLHLTTALAQIKRQKNTALNVN